MSKCIYFIKVESLNMNIVNNPYYVFTEYKKGRRQGQDTTRYLSTINLCLKHCVYP